MINPEGQLEEVRKQEMSRDDNIFLKMNLYGGNNY